MEGIQTVVVDPQLVVVAVETRGKHLSPDYCSSSGPVPDPLGHINMVRWQQFCCGVVHALSMLIGTIVTQQMPHRSKL